MHKGRRSLHSREFPEISIQTHAFERLCHSLWRELQQNGVAVNLCRIARLPSSCFALRHAKSAITQITVEWYHRNIARLHLLSQITPRHPSYAPLHSACFCLRKKIYVWHSWRPAIRSFSEGWWRLQVAFEQFSYAQNSKTISSLMVSLISKKYSPQFSVKQKSLVGG